MKIRLKIIIPTAWYSKIEGGVKDTPPSEFFETKTNLWQNEFIRI